VSTTARSPQSKVEMYSYDDSTVSKQTGDLLEETLILDTFYNTAGTRRQRDTDP